MKTLLTVLLLCCFIVVKAQTNFLPGYVITHEGNTLHGLIDYRSDARNARRCYFKENADAPVQEFLPGSIKSYRFNQGKYYISRDVAIKGIQEPVFLEFLVDGISDLFYFNDGKNYHYFIEKADGLLYELSNEEKEIHVGERTYKQASRIYIGGLKYAFSDCSELFPLINNARLNHKSLINISKKYHHYKCDDYQCIVYEKQLPVVNFRLGASVTFNTTMMQFINNEQLSSFDFGTATYPALELLLNTALPRASEKFSLLFSGEFSNPYFHGTLDNTNDLIFEEMHIHTYLAKTRAGIKYSWPKGKFRPSLLAGANYTFLLNTDRRQIHEARLGQTVYTTEISELPFPKKTIGFNADLGVDYVSAASITPFIKLGYETSSASNKIMFSEELGIHLNTIKLHAGIYF